MHQINKIESHQEVQGRVKPDHLLACLEYLPLSPLLLLHLWGLLDFALLNHQFFGALHCLRLSYSHPRLYCGWQSYYDLLLLYLDYTIFLLLEARLVLLSCMRKFRLLRLFCLLDLTDVSKVWKSDVLHFAHHLDLVFDIFGREMDDRLLEYLGWFLIV